MYDIAGLRIMCQFVDDIDVVVNILRQRKILVLLKKGLYSQYQTKWISLLPRNY